MRGRRQVISIPRLRARVTEHVVLERTSGSAASRWVPNRITAPSRRAARTVRRVSVQSEGKRTKGGVPASPLAVIQRYLKGAMDWA